MGPMPNTDHLTCSNCGDAFDGPVRDCPNPSPGRPLIECGRGGHMFTTTDPDTPRGDPPADARTGKEGELAALRRIADAAITLAYGEQPLEALPALQAAIVAARAFLTHPALPKEEPAPEMVRVSLAEVLGYLQEHPGSTCQAIGAALSASTAQVRGILYYAATKRLCHLVFRKEGSFWTAGPLTAEAFEEDYAARAGLTVATLRAMGSVVRPCACAERDCRGWQLARNTETEGAL